MTSAGLPAYLENDLADALPLDGEWEFRLGDAPPILIEVPCAWETHTRDKITDGPAFYRLWERVPHPGYADMRFFSIATDFAIDPLRLAELIGAGARLIPIWRRFDARAMTWADYLLEVQYGAGRMFVTTLRFEGGLGAQPDSFDTNPMGAWMLAALLNTLET